MSKHTPGPWHLGTPSAAYDNSHMCEVMTEYATKNEGATVGCHDVICRTWSPNHMASSVRLSWQECYANARLIAAAPELLEALRTLLSYANTLEMRLDADGEHRAMQQARAAIAKAEAA